MSWTAAARAAQVLCALVALISMPLAFTDLLRWAQLVLAQMTGPAPGSDFLNLYTGAALMLRDPASTYSLDAQRGVQSAIAASDVPLVPFYLPPYAALLIAPLGWLPYWLAYLVWLAINVGCVWAAAVLLAPANSRPRLYGLAWGVSAVLVLPVLLALALGQTSAVMLFGFALAIRALGDEQPGAARGALGGLTWLLKPQFAPWPLAALLIRRRFKALGLMAGLAMMLGVLAVWRMGTDGLKTYVALSGSKTREALTADPAYLPGPTLLHVAQSLIGPGGGANLLALALVAVAFALVVRTWRRGLATDPQARAVQLASLPIAAVICAPYALVHELTLWLASFWLLFPVASGCPRLRAGLWGLSALIWLAGDIGVVLPTAHGGDAAALLGLVALAGLAWARDHVRTPDALSVGRA